MPFSIVLISILGKNIVPVYTKTNEQLNNYAELLHDFKLLEEGFKWANDVYEAVLNAYKKDDNEVEQDYFDDY